MLAPRGRARRAHLQPGPRRACRPPPPRRSERLVDLVHERTERRRHRVSDDAHRRAGDGLRDGERPRRHRALLHRHPRRPHADARASRRSCRTATRRSATCSRCSTRRARRPRASSSALNAERRPDAFRAYLGMKHSPPFIPEGVAAMREDGIERARRDRDGAALVGDVGRDLRRTGRCRRSRTRAAVRRSRSFASYHDHPAFIAFLAARVARRSTRSTPDERAERRRDLLRALAAVRTLDGRLAALQDLRLRRTRAATGTGCRRRPTWSPARLGPGRLHRSRGRAPDERPTRGGGRRSRT